MCRESPAFKLSAVTANLIIPSSNSIQPQGFPVIMVKTQMAQSRAFNLGLLISLYCLKLLVPEGSGVKDDLYYTSKSYQ
jgi:hypothetical protein